VTSPAPKPTPKPKRPKPLIEWQPTELRKAAAEAARSYLIRIIPEKLNILLNKASYSDIMIKNAEENIAQSINSINPVMSLVERIGKTPGTEYKYFAYIAQRWGSFKTAWSEKELQTAASIIKSMIPFVEGQQLIDALVTPKLAPVIASVNDPTLR
jgi:hypothetical protein